MVKSEIQRSVQMALEEDIGGGDLTASLIDASVSGKARVVSREKAVLCGTDWFDQAFIACDDTATISWQVNDGDEIHTDQVICEITGNARALVTAERTALNFLQTLSATATQTRRFVELTDGTGCKILDTRKTIPLLRHAQKYAVRCGGGVNHRIGLFDEILIKENHIEAAGSVENAINRMRETCPGKRIEIEVEDLQQLEEAISAGADILLLDNFTLAHTEQAVQRAKGRVILEASGGFEMDQIAAIAATGVDFISVGALTKHIRAIDFSMRFE